MDFSTELKLYMNKINCTLTELSNYSKLSKATISRYCNGSRIPVNPSKELDKLIDGLVKISNKNKLYNFNEKSIKEDFENLLKTYDIEKLIINFNQLISVLKINISDFSKVLGFDPSHLSRIRSGERKPSNPSILIDGISNYVIKNYTNNENREIICKLINCSLDEINSAKVYKEKLNFWLCFNDKEFECNNDINNFLTKLNDFDLNKYIKVIKFDKLKVPTIPFKIPKSKNYYGLEKMKQGELDFFKGTVLSKSKESVFMCSDMQMDDMAKDLDFGKKWMFGIALSLKKGLHLNIIHNLDRPFNEMMIGLESWIPIYMTGQISPFYLPYSQSNTYSHLNYVSGNSALTGECIKGYHNKGKYYLTNKKDEVEYCRIKSEILLRKAKPLMKIYTKDSKNSINSFIKASITSNENIKIISSSLPIYTISDKLLNNILLKNKISKKDVKLIKEFIKHEKERMKNIITTNSVQEIINKVTKKEFKDFPLFLELSKLFYDKKIVYSYEDYLNHFNETKEYQTKNKNYKLILNKELTFRNIQIFIISDKKVMISKIDNPTIHFVIEHPKLCKAIENFIAPVIEK